MGTRFNGLNEAERTAVAKYVSAGYGKLLFQQPISYVSKNAQTDPERWQDSLRELIAADPNKVQEIMKATRSKATQGSGFTLIEIAVVLVIIGLIVGGILAGQTLIRAAELRSIIKTIEQYRTAVNTFRTKYDALPGDMSNATSIWATNPACPTAGATGNYPTAPTQTCNGNGDGQVGDPTGSTYLLAAERFQFWQHLALANMIPGQYQGITDEFGGLNVIVMPPAYTTQPFADSGVPNVPGIDYNNGAITTYYQGGAGTGYAGRGACFYNGDYGHIFAVGGWTVNRGAVDPLFTAADAHAIDQKVDDGFPGEGSVTVWPGTCQGTCASHGGAQATASSGATDTYDTNTSERCNLIFSSVY